MKKLVCLSLILLVFLAACAAAETPEQRIERVVTEMFSEPDAALEAFVTTQHAYASDPDGKAKEDYLRARETYAAHLKTRFDAADFGEAYFERFCAEDCPQNGLSGYCAAKGASLCVEQAAVTARSQAERLYDVSLMLTAEKDGHTRSLAVSGKVQTDAESRIVSVEFSTADAVRALADL